MACCQGAGQCRCRVSAEADDGCNPVQATVSGSGTDAAPFVVGTTWEPERAFRVDGNEPWQIGTEGGCDILIPRQYRLHESRVMCDGSGAHAGYAIIILDVDAGTELIRYQALDTTTLQASLPGGWTFCCPQSSAQVHAMCTAAVVEGDPDTLVGYAMIRYDLESDTYQQQYVNLAGTITTTLPTNWIPCGCGADGAGSGDPDVTLTENYIVSTVPLVLPDAADITLTNMASAEDWFNSTSRYSTRIDLTDWEQARLVVRKLGTAGSANSEIAVEYSTTNPNATFTGANWSALGTSDIECAINTTNTTIVSSWVNITALARDDVYIAPLMRGGDGAADPVVGRIDLQLRRQVVTDVLVEGGGGGGGGGDQATGNYPLRVGVDGVVEDSFYPDHGLPGIAQADAVDIFRLPTGFTTATWLNMAATLHNVTAAPTADVIVKLRNVTAAADVATITIASGTAPTSNRIVTDVAGSGTAADEDALQWQITSAPADNAYALVVDAFYELS